MNTFTTGGKAAVGGFDVIDPRYQGLYERACAVLDADPRVVRVQVGGSVASGQADRWSDLDLQVVSRPDHHRDFLADWPAWLAKITPTVFARTPIAPFIINAVTAEGLTLDIAVHAGDVPAWRPSTDYSVGGLTGVRFADVGDALEYAVAEQLRGLAGPFISFVGRGEHLRHLTGVPHLLGLLTTVFLAESGRRPPLGKLWGSTFTDDQLAMVEGLPPVAARHDDIVAFGLAVAEQVVTRARPLYPRYGLTWPSALASVAATRVRERLDIDVSAWLE